GFEWRWAMLSRQSGADMQKKYATYRDRLQFEIDVINQMGFAGYFLIVMDFIGWAKDHQIPVGPGRGSGAGSLVAYALKITDLDPLQYDLLFERFLNPERVSMPDFDIDFCMDGRDRVIDYVAERYGRSAVSQIITFGSMAAKAVVRDVARVQGKSYALADRLSKMIPFEPGITLSKAIEEEAALRETIENDEEAAEIWEMALQLEGIVRNVGKHAGGVVIAPTQLTDFCPLYCDETGGNLVTQYDKDDVESVGLVKFDFLGLRTLTIIDWALGMIKQQRSSDAADVDISALPLDDQATFALLQRAETTAVFQLESRGMKDLIKRLQPSSFEDIVALVALFRPGPLQSGMVDDFINRKHGRAAVEYAHPDLEGILQNTYGVILYQEQVMQIAQVLANYTLGQADMLRRAMGKKKPEEMEKQRAVFNQGALARGISEETATYIFDLMEKFSGYGFNKSHSAAYALVSYQTAWLKTHFPACFMAAVLSSDMDNTDKVVVLIEECRSMNLKVQPPMINDSAYKFTVVGDVIVYGLGAVKGVGEGAIDAIVSERNLHGPFSDLFEFCRRVDVKKLNRRTLEALIRAGAMDCLDQNRATLFANLDQALRAAEQHANNQSSGTFDLFGDKNDSTVLQADYNVVAEWNDDVRLEGEKDTLGLYLTGHPIDQYQAELAKFISHKLVDLQPQSGEKKIIAGLVVALRTMKTKKGATMAFLTLDDRSARVEVSFFTRTYEQYKQLLNKDVVLVVEGEASFDDFSGNVRFNVDRAFDFGGARAAFAKRLDISVTEQQLSASHIMSLKNALDAAKGGDMPVMINYLGERAEARLRLGERWKVKPDDALLAQLYQLYGAEQVSVKY
ncbi:MAG TPA: DNA polymerase III subunit alpha, partial [Pseudomonadales bacterium]|nr:DNA polymerase III subunit alpha [Pseudomonadales bacterium]